MGLGPDQLGRIRQTRSPTGQSEAPDQLDLVCFLVNPNIRFGQWVKGLGSGFGFVFLVSLYIYMGSEKMFPKMNDLICALRAYISKILYIYIYIYII